MAYESHRLVGDEKKRYLQQLDTALDVLSKNLVKEKEEYSDELKKFGEEHKWEWGRLPRRQRAYGSLSNMVRLVRDEYRWFDWLTGTNPEKNRGFFEEISIHPENGLPWAHDFIALHNQQRNAVEKLKQTPAYDQLATEARSILLTDEIDTDQVASRIDALHKKAMNRGFFEQLKEAKLLGWKTDEYSLAPQARLVLSLGAEKLWNISFMRYDRGASEHHLYSIDLWQDTREPQIEERVDNSGIVSKELAEMLKFARGNTAHYMIGRIDDAFKSLHPVHVTRALIGPFENRYMTTPVNPTLPITPELLALDHNIGLMRFSRQYSYAPNHEIVNDEYKQVLHRQEWCDEVIVAPAAYSSRIADSIKGTKIRIFEM